jgi:hypothetical protein
MDYVLLMLDQRGEAPRAAVSAEQMEEFARELATRGVLRDPAGPPHPGSEGTRVRVRNGAAVVTDGPFADAREVVGYYVVEAPDRAAAIEIAKRCPYARAGAVEVHALKLDWRTDGSAARRFVFLYLWGPEATAPDPSGMAEMGTFSKELALQGKLIAGGRLPTEIAPARVEVRGAQALVTDGPFAETKEVVAGFALVEAASRAEAVEIAERVPHAKWDTVVVREVGRFADQ